MLVLSRRRGERIRIGEHIEVVVTEMRRGFVRLGIAAPPGVPIVREEVYREIVRENRRAALLPEERRRSVERALASVVATKGGGGTKSLLTRRGGTA